MAIGVPLKEIKHTTLSDLTFYDDAHKLKDEIKDMWCWYMGTYVKDALEVVLSNAFAEKGTPPIEYRKKPFLQDSKELTEEEKQAQINALFGSLEVMEHNFRTTHGEKKHCPI